MPEKIKRHGRARREVIHSRLRPRDPLRWHWPAMNNFG
jgi:hypothetical protein